MANAWHTIKRLAGQDGKVVVVEGDEATHVVLTVEAYDRLLAPKAPEQHSQTAKPVEHWGGGEAPTPGSIRIEDLPL